MNKTKVLALIVLSSTIEEADVLISEYLNTSDVNFKLQFLLSTYNVHIFDRVGDDVDTDYMCVLHSIIKQKWRN